MKKMVASIATGVMLVGATMTTVSAADYDVEKGDNLWAIAQDHNTTVNELVDINDLKTTTIHPKQTIAIDENNDNKTSYSVEKGDTLFGISNENGVTVADLKDWNNLDSNIIQIGQELQINGAAVEQDEQAEPSKANEASSAQANDSKQEASEQTAKSDKAEANKQETNKPEENNQATSNHQPSNNQSNNQSSNQSQDKPDGETVSVSATAYTADCAGCSGVTSTGVDLNANPNKKVIAVDPAVIPLGSEVYVEGYGRATAADTGGAINGHKIDVHVASEGEANSWGVQNVNVTILN